jgi:hypothetical protein
LAEYLLPMAEAFSRFMPEVTDIASRAMLYSQIDQFKAGVVEGDLVVSKGGLVYTNELVPAFERARLGALFVTGSLIAPNATIAEPDIDWSPLLKIKGNVVAQNLCLGGSASEIDGDVTVTGVLMGYYNHGQIHIHGKTRVRTSCWSMIITSPSTGRSNENTWRAAARRSRFPSITNATASTSFSCLR